MKFIGKQGSAHALPADHEPGDNLTYCGQRFNPRKWGYVEKSQIRDFSRDRFSPLGLCRRCADKMEKENLD
jgi:hypothetical protein